MDGDRQTHGYTESPDYGLPEGLPEDMAPTILAALASGRKIEAIKLLRDATGLGLREARIIVEQLESDYEAGKPSPPPAPGFSEEGGVKSLVVIAVALVVGYLLYRYLTGG